MQTMATMAMKMMMNCSKSTTTSKMSITTGWVAQQPSSFWQLGV